ncbi:unnamed protein product [Paramecium sonneborni]|uniref:Uncharacterized protein n=1 Tax=Paramecium sonneborni TaxID=65129 RepID=A0A8S1MR08_9CILI|nr:unnamed protein product [Paramecium sonneborni]
MNTQKMNTFFGVEKPYSFDSQKSQSSSNTNQQQFTINIFDQQQNQTIQKKENVIENFQQQKKNDINSDSYSNSSSEAGLLQTKKLQKILEENYDYEVQSVNLSENTMQKYQKQKINRIQNANKKYSLEIKNSQLNNSQLYTQQDKSRNSNSQDSFEPNIQISRRHTDNQEQLARQINYFKPQKFKQINQLKSNFNLEIGVQADSDNLNKLFSKTLNEQSSEISSKNYYKNENKNLLKLLDKNTNQKFSQQQSQEDNNELNSDKQVQIQLNLEQNDIPLSNHLSKLQANNIAQKNRMSQFSQKTVPNLLSQFSQQTQYQNIKQGTVLNTCKSLSGDIFTLRPGNKVIVLKIDQDKKLIQCGYENMLGLFYLRDIAIKDGMIYDKFGRVTVKLQVSNKIKNLIFV